MRKFLKNKKNLVLVMAGLFMVIIAVTGVAAAARGDSAAAMMSGNSQSGESAPSQEGAVSGEVLASEEPLDGLVPSEEGEGVGGSVSYNRPDQLRGVYLIPGEDFFAGGNYSEEAVKAEIDKALGQIADMSMNAVIIQTAMENCVIYNSENLPRAVTSFDPLEYAVSAAKNKGLYVYCIYNLLTMPGESEALEHASPVTASVLDTMADELSGFIKKYKPDGILLADYYNPETETSYADYLTGGGGIGYQNYMESISRIAVETAAGIIHTKAPGVQVGLLTTAVWANEADNAAGSKTNADFAAWTDGNADVLAFVEDKLVDFVAVEAFGSQSDKAIPFNTVANWWCAVGAQNDLPVYLVHASSKLGSGAAGWGDAAQLAAQVIAANAMDGYAGSAFDSLSKLLENPGGATDNLLDYFKDQTAAQFILAQLEFSKPTQTTFTTSEPTVTFQGGSDPRNELLMDGKVIQTGESGYFSVTADLNAGLNTFTFEHKGKTVTFNITRKIVIIDAVSPEGSLAVDGGMQITVIAYAYEGASVSATLNGRTTALARDEVDQDESYRDSNYVKYSGTITVPAGTSSVQKLGNIVVSATYQGQTQSYTGASVSVNKVAAIGSGKPVVVTATDAETFPTNTLNDLSASSCYPLPKGALDYTLGDELVYKEGNSTYRYYILESGQRVYSSDISTTSSKADSNVIKGMTVSNTGTYTDVILNMEQKVSYTAAYTSSGMSFTFHYTKSVPGDLTSLSKTPLFKSATWSGTTLTLKFRVSNGMVGYRAYYDSSGNLVLRFNNVPTISGAKIVVDPGHGGTDYGALGFNPNYPEKVINWQIAKRLASVLENKGANVLLINTQVSSGKVDLYNRMNQAYNFGPQLLISVHNNSATTASAKGHEVYYFYPWSSLLSSKTNSALGDAIGNADRGSKFGRYFVTRSSRFAAVLVECAFMSNEYEYYNYLLDTGTQQSIANELADAIVRYFQALRASGSYSTGSESVGSVAVTAPTSITLSKTALTLTTGGSETLTATVKPDGASTALSWKSSDEKVATVDASGKVTAVAAGTATITATSEVDSKISATCTVTVSGKAVTGVTLDKTTAEVTVGGSLQLTATVTPSDAANKSISWSSSDKSVATVDTSGKVTAVGEGTATITAEAADGSGYKATCKVTVSAAAVSVTGVTLDKTTAEVTVGASLQLTATVTPSDAANKNISWSSSDKSVATVDASGKVTAVGEGTADITVITADGGKTDVCSVTVTAAAVSVTGVTVEPAALTLTAGEHAALSASVEPADAANKSISWSSSDKSVATVDASGKVTAVGEGTADITVTTADGGKTASCTVTVSAASSESSSPPPDEGADPAESG